MEWAEWRYRGLFWLGCVFLAFLGFVLWTLEIKVSGIEVGRYICVASLVVYGLAAFVIFRKQQRP